MAGRRHSETPAYPHISAGLPVTIASAGTSRVTTAPAPIIDRSPMVSPGRMVAFAPIEAPFRIRVRGSFRGCCVLRGNRSFVKVALGPMKTSSSTLIPSPELNAAFHRHGIAYDDVIFDEGVVADTAFRTNVRARQDVGKGPNAGIISDGR